MARQRRKTATIPAKVDHRYLVFSNVSARSIFICYSTYILRLFFIFLSSCLNLSVSLLGSSSLTFFSNRRLNADGPTYETFIVSSSGLLLRRSCVLSQLCLLSHRNLLKGQALVKICLEKGLTPFNLPRVTRVPFFFFFLFFFFPSLLSSRHVEKTNRHYLRFGRSRVCRKRLVRNSEVMYVRNDE